MIHKMFNKAKGILAIAALTATISLAESYTTFAAPLKAGVVSVNITRDNPTTLINDPLYAKILVLDDGSTRAVIITTDLIKIEDPLLREIRNRIQEELKIKWYNVMICASHNHQVNNQVAEDFITRIVNGVKTASQRMVNVKIGAGAGKEDRITMNRRIELTNGREWTIRRAIPSPQDEFVKGIADPFDPEIGILRIDKMDGKPLAVLYNFAGHPYGGVPNLGATACFSGFASKTIEENLGNGAVALFLQGALGDITPVLYKDMNAPRPSRTLGTLLGMSTLDGHRKISTKKNAGINIIREVVELPVRKDIQLRIDSLNARRDRILDYFKGEGCGAHGAGTKLNFEAFLPLYIKYGLSPQYPSYYSYRYMQEEKVGKNDLKMMDSVNRRDIAKYLNNIYKMEELIMIESNLLYLVEPLPEDPIKVEIMAVRIGEFVLISFPGELFARIGLNIKQFSPYEYTYITSLTNGEIPGSYALSSDAYDGEAYEASCSKLAPEWQKIYENKVLEILNKL
ncbi:hypothetical protein ACFLU5_12895 [Bacteroidota bacterium]